MTEAIRQGDIPGVQLRRRRLLARERAETVWPWLREVEKMESWLADRAAFPAGADGPVELRAGGELEIGETLALEPPQSWVLAFRRREWPVKTRLALDLRETPAGVELSVLQQGFEKLPLSSGLTLWEAYRRRWTVALDRLAAVLAATSGGAAPALE